jgi:sec-independent protein translocase protein TatB
MPDIGWMELLVIGIVALIVVGPNELPGMFRKMGQFTGRIRAMAKDFQRAMDEAADETGMTDLNKDLKGRREVHLQPAQGGDGCPERTRLAMWTSTRRLRGRAARRERWPKTKSHIKRKFRDGGHQSAARNRPQDCADTCGGRPPEARAADPSAAIPRRSPLPATTDKP